MTPAEFDAHYPLRGPCGICGCPGLDGRHRLLDAIRDRHAAGDSVEDLARDYGRPAKAIRAALHPRHLNAVGPAEGASA